MTLFYVRDKDTGADGSGQLAWTEIELGTATADAVQRLAHVQAQIASSELVARAIGALELSRASGQEPAAGLALSGKRLGHATDASTRRMSTVACPVANVPGPGQPLYLCRARMKDFSAMMSISDGMRLAFAATSYDGRSVISPTSHRDLMPDLGVFAQRVRDACQDPLPAARAAAPRLPRVCAAHAPTCSRSAKRWLRICVARV